MSADPSGLPAALEAAAVEAARQANAIAGDGGWLQRDPPDWLAIVRAVLPMARCQTGLLPAEAMESARARFGERAFWKLTQLRAGWTASLAVEDPPATGVRHLKYGSIEPTPAEAVYATIAALGVCATRSPEGTPTTGATTR